MGANDRQTLKAFREAEAFDGPSLIIAYSHCIAHGYDMAHGMEQQKLAVQSGYWPLLRYNPAAAWRGQEPLATRLARRPRCRWSSTSTTRRVTRCWCRATPRRRAQLLRLAQQDVHDRWRLYEHLAARTPASWRQAGDQRPAKPREAVQ